MNKLVEKYGSRKLLVWVSSTALLLAGKIDVNSWLIATGAYLGALGAEDVASRFKKKE